MAVIPEYDNAQEIIGIAKRIQDSGINAEHFAVVFNAIVQVRYSQYMKAPHTVEINQVLDKATAATLQSALYAAVLKQGDA